MTGCELSFQRLIKVVFVVAGGKEREMAPVLIFRKEEGETMPIPRK
jgi:hypothetical protein